MHSPAEASVPVPAGPGLSDPIILSLPRQERPRERLQALGARQLGDAELLALLLRTGGGGSSVLGLAWRVQALAQARGGYHALQEADLRSLKGVGAAKAGALLAALELGRRAGARRQAAPPLRGPEAAAEALRGLLDGRLQEHVAVLALDARRRVVAAELVSQGTLTQSLAHPREVFRSAIKLGAAAVVVGHNHPSGDPAPSPDDHALTRRLRQAAELLGIPLLDHLIVADGASFSYAQQGWPG